MFQRTRTIESIVNNLQSLRHVLMGRGHSFNKGLGITITQANVLFLIKHKSTMNASEIAGALGVTKSAATQLIDTLVDQDLLVRETDDNDRRIQKITLSVVSKKRISLLREKTVKMFSSTFEVLGDRELVELEKITQRILNSKKEIKEC